MAASVAAMLIAMVACAEGFSLATNGRAGMVIGVPMEAWETCIVDAACEEDVRLVSDKLPTLCLDASA